MRKRHFLRVLVLLAAAVFGGYFAGYRSAMSETEDLMDRERYKTETFYAVITETDHGSMEVRGLEINSLNYRGNYTFPINKETLYLWRGTRIQPSELRKGQRVSVTYTGEIMESDPGQIGSVIKVELLEDEKDENLS